MVPSEVVGFWRLETNYRKTRWWQCKRSVKEGDFDLGGNTPLFRLEKSTRQAWLMLKGICYERFLDLIALVSSIWGENGGAGGEGGVV